MNIRYMILFLLFLLVVGNVTAQENTYNIYFSKEAQITILVDDIIRSNHDIQGIINEYDIKVDKIDIDNQNKMSTYIFITEADEFDAVISRLEVLGTIEVKRIETKNNINELETIDFDTIYLKEQKQYYRRELESMDRKNDPENYQELWKKEREFDELIYQKNREKQGLQMEVTHYIINFQVNEKTIQYLDDSDGFFNFVNMPGIESYFYMIENPDNEQSADAYVGGALRYLFTKGKSFFTIGILKPILNVNEDSPVQANDIVTYSLGKDFYPRYLGRGKRTFFNPYSGFQLGGMILTSENKIEHIFTAEPHLGLELFKNKYIIIDLRCGYIFPLDPDKIKTHRGFTQNFTFNVVF